MSDYAALAQLAGTGAQIKAQADLNKANRKWQEHVYQMQKKDNISFWQMNNRYNRPEAQMQRFQDAGLNPHLIYGQGNSGNAGTAPSTPDMQNIPQRTPDFQGGVGATIGAIYDTRIKQAQHNNLEAQNTVLANEALLKQAQTAETYSNINTKDYDLSFKRTIEDYTKKSAQYAAELMEHNAAHQYNLNEHNIDMYPLRKKEMEIKLGHYRADQRVKDFHARMADVNLTPQDGMYWRLAEMLLNQLPDKFNPLKYQKK